MPGVSHLPNLLAANNHSKYALAALRLKASQLGLLTPGEAHRLRWNCFASRKGGEGKCISRDLLVEQVNMVSKEFTSETGAPNKQQLN